MRHHTSMSMDAQALKQFQLSPPERDEGLSVFLVLKINLRAQGDNTGVVRPSRQKLT